MHNFILPIFINADGQSVLLGSFRTLQHQVRGDLYAIDEKTIRIENFRYDGTGVSKLTLIPFEYVFPGLI